MLTRKEISERRRKRKSSLNVYCVLQFIKWFHVYILFNQIPKFKLQMGLRYHLLQGLSTSFPRNISCDNSVLWGRVLCTVASLPSTLDARTICPPFWQPKTAHCWEYPIKSWSYKQIIYLHMAGTKLNSWRSYYFIYSPPPAWAQSVFYCHDWEMCNIFQKSKVVSLWCQTTHLIWLKTYQFNFSNQTTATIKPDQTDSDVELICHHRQTARPGSHTFEIRLRIGQAAEVPPLSSDPFASWTHENCRQSGFKVLDFTQMPLLVSSIM